MARLIVDLDLEFDTLPFEYNHGPDEQGTVPSALLEKMLADATENDFGINICNLDPEDGWFQLEFLVERAGLKKGSICTYQIDYKKCTAHVVVKGIWQSTPLRKGVKELLEKQGKDVDFRLKSFVFKKGPWSGFEGIAAQFIREEYKACLPITKWQIK